MKRLLPSAVALFAIVAPTARAETVVLRPDPCPTSADQGLIIDLGEVETFTSYPVETHGSVLVIYPPARDGWASARLLMRFDFALAPPDPASPGCGAPRLFRVPR